MTEKVEIKSSSAESVALKLAERIVQAENLSNEDPEFRKKYLDIYAECLKATKFRRTFE